VTGDLWLSRVELGLLSSDARAVLGDAYARHRLVLKAFPWLTRQQARVLHHYTPPWAGRPPRLLVQSMTMPDWSFLRAEDDRSTVQVTNVGHLWDQVAAGARYRFRLTASPTRAVRGNRGTRTRGTRTPITDPTQQINWLARLLDGAANLTNVDVTVPATTTGRRGGRIVEHTSVTFTGVLTVTDAGRLRQQAIAGIGPDKAYGNGLLAIANEQHR